MNFARRLTEIDPTKAEWQVELAYAHNLIWLILGFVFMPTTALAYGLCVHYGLTAEEWWVAIPILAALFDLGLLGRVRQPKKEED